MTKQFPKLTPSSHFKKPDGPVLLIIMDGVGIGPKTDANAVHLAHTPFLDTLSSFDLYQELKAHGKAVGMPSDEDMGNSEVGHNALGAGRIFDQGASLVQNAINSESMYQGKTWNALVEHTKEKESTLHFIGLLSDGNVHSHINHLKSMIAKASQSGIKKIRLHTLLDGRDVDEKSACTYIDAIETFISSLDNTLDCKIASGGGRMITTMDRYNADWDIVKRGWDAHVLGVGDTYPSATEAVKTSYQNNPSINDQFIPPFVIVDTEGHPIGKINDNDSVILTNFRGDRAIEISQAFESNSFDKFDRVRTPDVFYAGMMEYDGDLHIPQKYLVDPPKIDHPIGYYMCGTGLTSFAISETQKYGHVTYFWNGNSSGYLDETLEQYIEIPSDKLPFDQRPEMKAYEITEKTIELLENGSFDFARVNLPNGDMVGHTGVMDAVIKSVEVTDECVQKMVKTVNKLNGITVILADHGNADEMFTEKNGVRTPKTSHTLNPVPFCIIDKNNTAYTLSSVTNAGLANVASTLCNLLGFESPKEYEPSLIRKKS